MVKRYFYCLVIQILKDLLVNFLELFEDRGVDDVGIGALEVLLLQNGVDDCA